jgi:predicted MFS family arabinose efflux permease
MGTVIAMPLAGILAEYVSWDSIFYVFGKIRALIKYANFVQAQYISIW